MAAVAAEPGAAAVPTTTITAAADDEAPPEPGPAGPGLPGPPLEADGSRESGLAVELGVPRGEDGADAEQRRHVGPELHELHELHEHVTDQLINSCPVDRVSMDRFSPGVPADSLTDQQPSAVFLHSVPAPPRVTEAGLSLDEPAEPTDRDRGYTVLVPPGPAQDPHQEQPVKQEDGSRPEPGPEPGLESVQDLSPGSEVRVCLDHVIDDALVVSFRLGEKVFSGVLMDVSKRFGPYGIPITVFPRRDDQSRPQMSVTSQLDGGDDSSTKQEEVGPAAPPHPWTSKPPPLFQEGAPYPPPLFIRDTYNQALPQPLPRKIKRPKRRYRCEEPTSIMNAIKLRPRQVLCDKCKGVVASGGHREARRGPVDLRGEEASRRRRPADGPVSSEVKRLRSDDKGGRPAADRRSSSGIRVSASPSSSSRRVLRGVASSSSSSSSGRMCLKLNSKKVLAKGSAVDRSKARQVLKKLARSSPPAPPPSHRRPKDQNQNQNQGHNQNQNQDRNKAVTRAAALQNHNQKVHFTRRQHLSGATVSSAPHTPLPPRMRLKPQSTTLKSC